MWKGTTGCPAVSTAPRLLDRIRRPTIRLASGTSKTRARTKHAHARTRWVEEGYRRGTDKYRADGKNGNLSSSACWPLLAIRSSDNNVEVDHRSYACPAPKVASIKVKENQPHVRSELVREPLRWGEPKSSADPVDRRKGFAIWIRWVPAVTRVKPARRFLRGPDVALSMGAVAWQLQRGERSRARPDETAVSFKRDRTRHGNGGDPVGRAGFSQGRVWG